MRRCIVNATLAGTAALLPLLFFQGNRVRRRMLRAAVARDATAGLVGGNARAPMLRLLVIGESSAAGVGVATHARGLAGQTGEILSARTGRSVQWRTLGRIGATVEAIRRELIDASGPIEADAMIVALGVNDTVRLRTHAQWRRSLAELIRALRSRAPRAVILISPVPPLGRMRTLPQPLRAVIGRRASVLDRAARRVCADATAVRYVAVPFDGAAALLCEDGLHPSERGYRVWASYMARAIESAIGQCNTTEKPPGSEGGSAALTDERQLERASLS